MNKVRFCLICTFNFKKNITVMMMMMMMMMIIIIIIIIIRAQGVWEM
jgi:hypothetical protein